MINLYLHSHKVDTVFQLLGEDENDISFSVAWALANCPSFLSAFLQSQLKRNANGKDIDIRLQHSQKTGGITDIEIESLGDFYLIIEAKKGWQLPGKTQLQKYANRRMFKNSQAPVKLILVLSECNQEYAKANLEVSEISGIPVKPVSWKDLARLAESAYQAGSHKEKHILTELLTYLRGLMCMQNLDSNWVYVVSLSNRKERGWGISWIDIIEKRKRYFHPVGLHGFPKEPVNYIAFRYYGKLQSIHHVEGYDVFNDPHEKFPEIPSNNWDIHYLYKLGPAFKPPKDVKTGKIYPSGRVWCMLDTLFTEDTIADARDRSKKREDRS